MSKRTALATLTLALFCSFAASSFAADAPAKGKSSAHSACAESVKKMKGMKTAEERDTFCKGDATCSANNCEAQMHHGKSKHHAATPAPATTAPKTN